MVKKILNLENLLLTGLLLAILPFFILAFFNHPQSDDYVHAIYTGELGLFGGIMKFYNVWSARYFAHFILGLNPLVFGSFFLYKVVTLIFLIVLFISIYFFVNALVSGGINTKGKIIISLAIIAVFLFRMPNVPEGIYWMAGAMANLLSIVMMSFLFGLLIRLKSVKDKKPRAVMIFLSVFLIFAISGTHELAMLYVLAILTIIMALDIFQYKRINWLIAVLLSVSIISSLIIILAPGTKFRYEWTHQFRPDISLSGSITSAFLHAFNDLTNWIVYSPIVVFIILAVSFFARIQRHRLSYIVHPAVSFTIFFLSFFASYLPSYQSTGIIETRTINGIFLFFLLGLFFNIYNAVSYYIVKLKKEIPELQRYILIPIGFFLVLNFAAKDSNLITAYSDLLLGTAYNYDRELKERYETIKNCQSYICEVKPLKNRPSTIFYFENAIDEEHDTEFYKGYKLQYAAYFGKFIVKLSNKQRSQ